MAGWHQRLNGHEFEHVPGDGEGQGRLACCSPWGPRESDTTKVIYTETHVHRVGDAIQPSHPLSYPSPPAPNPSQHQSLFQ